MVKTAQQAADKWAAAMQSPLTQKNYVDGINQTTINPMAKAAQNLQLYVQNTQLAVSSGRMAAALNSADPGMWKTNAATYGAPKLSTGANKGKPKYTKAATKLAPLWSQMRQASDALGPRGGLATAQAKANAALAVLMQGVGKA